MSNKEHFYIQVWICTWKYKIERIKLPYEYETSIMKTRMMEDKKI